jgi:hypothetical protein
MNSPSQMPPEPWNDKNMPMPDPLRMTMAMDRIMHAHSVVLMIKKLIWGMCVTLQTVLVLTCLFFLFRAESMDYKLICVILIIIAHEGMGSVFLWILLTSLRMDFLKELKGMELQLAELRTYMQNKNREVE